MVKALQYGYEKEEYVKNCDTLFEDGLCKGKCKHYTEKNFPLYKK